MSDFKVLQNNQRSMSTILRINFEQRNNRWMKSTNEFFTSIPILLILFIQFISLVISAFTLHNNSYDFSTKSAYALAIIALSQAITILLNMGLYMQKTVDLYHTLQAIVDSEGMDLFGIH